MYLAAREVSNTNGCGDKENDQTIENDNHQTE